jgi:hypothetical protein
VDFEPRLFFMKTVFDVLTTLDFAADAADARLLLTVCKEGVGNLSEKELRAP